MQIIRHCAITAYVFLPPNVSPLSELTVSKSHPPDPSLAHQARSPSLFQHLRQNLLDIATPLEPTPELLLNQLPNPRALLSTQPLGDTHNSLSALEALRLAETFVARVEQQRLQNVAQRPFVDGRRGAEFEERRNVVEDGDVDLRRMQRVEARDQRQRAEERGRQFGCGGQVGGVDAVGQGEDGRGGRFGASVDVSG